MLFELVDPERPDDLQQVPDGHAPVPAGCLLDVFGIHLSHVGRGRSRCEMRVREIHLNQRGLVQGGALVSLADAAAGWASYATLETGRFTTVELRCSFVGRADLGDVLVAMVSPVHLGRRLHNLEVDICRDDATGRSPRVARFGCTQMVLE